MANKLIGAIGAIVVIGILVNLADGDNRAAMPPPAPLPAPN